MPYKLMIASTTGYLTGQELFDHLTATGFTVPVKQPLVYPDRPVFPVKPANIRNATPEERALYYAQLEAYQARQPGYKLEMQANNAVYFKQFTDFANILRGIFVIATQVEVGLNPNGTTKREYQVIEPCIYSFEQCADKLLNYPPPDPIHFICFDKF